jgi:hypothetical protein
MKCGSRSIDLPHDSQELLGIEELYMRGGFFPANLAITFDHHHSSACGREFLVSFSSARKASSFGSNDVILLVHIPRPIRGRTAVPRHLGHI